MKKIYNKNSGSVLMIVVALLGFVYLLGMTYLIIVGSERKQARSLAKHAKLSPIAMEIVNICSQRLLDDLHVGADGPFTNLADSDGYKYIDISNDTADKHLAELQPLGRFSDLGLSGTIVSQVDTDGDGIDDADLMDLGLVSPEGRDIYVAVRIIDTSGMANVNLAGITTATGFCAPATPANYRLDEVVTATAGFITRERCNGVTILPNIYWPNAGCKITQPDMSFLPFSVAEEIYLRDSRVTSPIALAQAGRLAAIIELNPADRIARKFLTTYSVAMPTLRNPDIDQNRTERLRITADNLANGPDATANRQWLYEELLSATDRTGADKLEIAHFIANLWAFISTSDPNVESFAFKPGTETWTVYGVIPQLVITEVFAYNEKELTVGSNDPGWGYAIELLNPTAHTIDASTYKLKVGVNEYSFPNGTAVAAGEKLTLYTFGGDITTAGAKNSATAANFGFDTIPADKRLVVNFLEDLWSEDAVLYRYATKNGVTTDIPIDSVKRAELTGFGFLVTAPQTIDGSCDIQRDDDWDDYDPSPAAKNYGGRARSTVAEYESYHAAFAAGNKIVHELGKTNAVADTDLPNVLEGFFIHALDSDPKLIELAELSDIFITGPISTGDDLPHQLTNYISDPGRGKLDFDGTAVTPANYPPKPWEMLAMELLESVETDPTRIDSPRIYGKININTAPREVIAALPWPDTYWNRTAGTQFITTDKLALADAIIADRPFLTPGQVASTIKAFADDTTTAADQKKSAYAAAGGFKGLFKPVSNLISVRSDSFAIIVLLQSGSKQWKYLALIDRSNCQSKGDKPALLLFTQIR